ncbi:MAG: hypothetical protein ACJ8OJ_05110 [Povalibacter sp.]|jgi:hypothetical protein
MDTENARQLQVAVSHVHEAVNTLTLSGCDKDDMFELMERVDSELNSSHPNQQTVTMFLNSIARSLRSEPEAREICMELDDAMRRSGLPSTWQSGI